MEYLTDKIEFFDGIIRFNPFLLFLNIILIFHFCYTLWKRYKQTGIILNFWHLFIFKLIFLNMLIMYPFHGSFENKQSIDTLVFHVDKFMDLAYIISITGYFCFLLGGVFYSKILYKKLNTINHSNFNSFIYNNIVNNYSSKLLLFLSLGLLILLMSFSIPKGVLFDPRSMFLKDSSIRPIYNFVLSVYPISVIFFGLRTIEYDGFYNKLYFITLVVLSTFLGTRNAMLEPLVLLFFCYYLKNYSKIGIIKIISVFSIIILFALALSSLRENSFGRSNKFAEIIFGNHFSDTRDFALLLSHFDGIFLEGKTYLAGMMVFVPRKFSEFREEWSWGIWTAKNMGFVDPAFPGYRPGFFGEAYFNFGFIGVIIFSFISGCIIKRIDIKIINEFKSSNNVIKIYSYTIVSYIVLSCAMSVVFITLYIYCILMIVLALYRQIINFLTNKINTI